MARRRVRKLWEEAAKQAEIVNQFMEQIAKYNADYLDTLKKRIEDDAKIPKGNHSNWQYSQF